MHTNNKRPLTDKEKLFLAARGGKSIISGFRSIVKDKQALKTQKEMLTQEEIEDMVKKIFESGSNRDRHMVVHTFDGGMELFHKAMKKAAEEYDYEKNIKTMYPPIPHKETKLDTSRLDDYTIPAKKEDDTTSYDWYSYE